MIFYNVLFVDSAKLLACRFVNDCVMVREAVDYFVDEVTSLVAYQLDWTTESASNVFVEEFCCRGCRIVP